MKGKLFLRLGILLQNLFLNLPPQTVMLCKPFSNRSLMFQPADFTADPRRLKCLEESSEGTFHRQHDIGRKLEFPYTHKQTSNLRSDINQHLYRVSLLLVHLGWVDFDLGVPPSCPATSAKSQAKMGRHSKPKSTQPGPGPRADGTPCRLRFQFSKDLLIEDE